MCKLKKNNYVSIYPFNAYVLQLPRFASITFLVFHRTIRPANRIDPMRTVLEVSAQYIRMYLLPKYISSIHLVCY